MDTAARLGAVSKNLRDARNMVKQNRLIHGKTTGENGTATTGLKSIASPAKAIVQRCFLDRAAWNATRVALPQMTNCSTIA